MELWEMFRSTGHINSESRSSDNSSDVITSEKDYISVSKGM
jgi:hypothetical protein